MWFSDKKCIPGVGAVPVIIIVLQITYHTCIYFYAFEVAMQKKLTVLRCYDHNLNIDSNGDFEFDPVCFQWHFMKMLL